MDAGPAAGEEVGEAGAPDEESEEALGEESEGVSEASEPVSLIGARSRSAGLAGSPAAVAAPQVTLHPTP